MVLYINLWSKFEGGTVDNNNYHTYGIYKKKKQIYRYTEKKTVSEYIPNTDEWVSHIAT